MLGTDATDQVLFQGPHIVVAEIEQAGLPGNAIDSLEINRSEACVQQGLFGKQLKGATFAIAMNVCAVPELCIQSMIVKQTQASTQAR